MPAGVARPIGDELVRVLADLRDAKASGLDRAVVGVPLGGATNARCSQVDIADDRVRELRSLTMSAIASRPPARLWGARRFLEPYGDHGEIAVLPTGGTLATWG